MGSGSNNNCSCHGILFTNASHCVNVRLNENKTETRGVNEASFGGGMSSRSTGNTVHVPPFSFRGGGVAGPLPQCQ